MNIAGMATGLERQHEGMGRTCELDVRGWAGMGTNVRRAGGCGVATPTPCKTLFNTVGHYTHFRLGVCLIEILPRSRYCKKRLRYRVAVKWFITTVLR